MNTKIITISVLIEKCNEDSIHQQMKEVYLKLQADVFEYGLLAEFADFFLEHPEMNIFEINKHFRNEWDL